MKLYILFMFSIVFVACTTQTTTPYRTRATTVVYDKTDTLLVQPNSHAIITASGVREHPSDAYHFSITAISALTNAPVYSLSVANDSVTNTYNTASIPDFRDMVLHQFIKNVQDTIRAFIRDSTIKDFETSECFATICKALQRKPFATADERYMYIFSDLFENTALLNIYTQKNYTKEKIQALFEQQQLLPDSLPHMHIHFVYQPKHKEDDVRYNLLFSVYKSMLEKRGAEVIQQTTMK